MPAKFAPSFQGGRAENWRQPKPWFCEPKQSKTLRRDKIAAVSFSLLHRAAPRNVVEIKWQ
jgi:hypothetical protein